MKKLILILLSLFTFVSASQKFILSTKAGRDNEDKKRLILDMNKSLLFNDTKAKETLKEYKTLTRRQEEDNSLQYTCTLSSSLWIKEDVVLLEGEKEVIIKNIPVHFSSFRYHAV